MSKPRIRMESRSDGGMEINIHGCSDDQMEAVKKQFDLDGSSCSVVFITPNGFYRNEDNIPQEYKKMTVEVIWYGE